MSDSRIQRWLRTGAAVALMQAAAFSASAQQLTEFGAIRGANADGSIPAYTGGLTRPPAGYQPGSGVYINPFADEAPIETITADNLAQYTELLSPGTLALFERSPDYKINVYRTHRTMSYPSWFLENTTRNATGASLGGSVAGDAVQNLLPGIPFPTPKDGYEVMWNAFLHFDRHSQVHGSTWLVDTRGRPVRLLVGFNTRTTPIYEGDTSVPFTGHFMANTIRMIAPANLAGYIQVQRHPIDYGQGQENWVFDPGQRRVRVAPNYTYDTPVAQYGGALFYDEGFGFFGRLDRFEFKLIGRKEMIVPYNNYDVFTADPQELLGQRYMNPDIVRWERHRVWVVEATRKSGARHAYSKRQIFIDEDSYAFLLTEGYDNSGRLARIGQGFPQIDYTGNGGMNTSPWVYYDLIKGNYLLTYGAIDANTPAKWEFLPRTPNPDLFTPQGIANLGNR